MCQTALLYNFNTLEFSTSMPWRHVRGAKIELYSLLMEGEWWSWRPGRFTPSKTHGTHLREGGGRRLYSSKTKNSRRKQSLIYTRQGMERVCTGQLRSNGVTVVEFLLLADDCSGTAGLDAEQGSADKTNSCHAVADWRCWFYLWIPVDAGIRYISPLRWQAADHHFKTLLLLLLLLVSRFAFQIIACSGIHL